MVCIWAYILTFLALKTPHLFVCSFTYKQCDMKLPSRGILDLKQPSKPARLLNATTTLSLKNCSKHCCDVVNCNAYIWRNSEQCYLFECKVLEDCKVVPYQGTITGFVSRNVRVSEEKDLSVTDDATSNKEPAANSNSAQLTDLDNNYEQKEKPSVLETTHVKKQPDASPHVIQKEKYLPAQNESKKEKEIYFNQAQSKRTSKGHNATSKINNEKNVTTTKQTILKKKQVSHRKISASMIPVLVSAFPKQKVSHTTTVSLVAALAFGLVFLVAVIVLIGRPWWQSIPVNRNGYNRITFLMNGK